MQGNAAPHHPQHSPSFLTPHPSSWATTRVAPTPLKDSGRTQTSSFRAQSRNPCSPALQHRCCDYAQHDGVCRAPLPPITHSIRRHSSLLTPHHGQPQGLPLHPSKTAAEPKLRHSACSRGIHVPLHSTTTRSMTACVGQRCPPSPTPFPVIPHPSSWATTRVAPTPLKDSGRTQTSSFRAQSRNPCSPALQHRCCDYAQHDSVCRAPLPPITHSIRRHSSLLTPHHATTSPYAPQRQRQNPNFVIPRAIHVPLHSNLDAATTRSMTACAPLPPITHSIRRHSSLLTHHHGQPQGLRRQNPNFVIPCAVAESMFPCTPT